MGRVNSRSRLIAFFYLLANTGTIIDRGTDCKVLAYSLLYVSHHMRSCATKLPVLAILASTGSIPRNSDTAPPRPRRTPPDFTGLRRGLASAWPRHKGLPFVRDSLQWHGVYLRCMELGPFIRDVDDAGFSLRRCVHSSWTIAGCPAQHNDFGSKPQKANPIQTNLEGTGVLVQMCGLSFDGLKREQVNWQVVGSLYTCLV